MCKLTQRFVDKCKIFLLSSCNDSVYWAVNLKFLSGLIVLSLYTATYSIYLYPVHCHLLPLSLPCALPHTPSISTPCTATYSLYLYPVHCHILPLSLPRALPHTPSISTPYTATYSLYLYPVHCHILPLSLPRALPHTPSISTPYTATYSLYLYPVHCHIPPLSLPRALAQYSLPSRTQPHTSTAAWCCPRPQLS